MDNNLELFEGRKETFPIKVNEYSVPMDMLLDLINRAEIPIREVLMSNVTNQYLEYIKTLDVLDFEKASFFVSYAARILDLKVRALLPKTEEETLQFEEEQESFFNELEMRKVFLDAMGMLHTRETINVFGIEPEFTKNDYKIVISDDEFNMDALMDAFAHIMHKFQTAKEERKDTKVIVKDRFTVVDKTKELIVTLKEKRTLSFYRLFEVQEGERQYTVSEGINTFLALLELLRRQFAQVEQDTEFGDIVITLAPNADNMTYEDIIGGEPYIYDESDTPAKKAGGNHE